MAFCDLKPVSVTDDSSGVTYIIGRVFSVCSFGADCPAVYSWDMVRSVSVMRDGIAVTAGGETYSVPGRLFSAPDEFLRAVALIECAQRKNRFEYIHDKRILPLKSLYKEFPQGNDAYVGECEIDGNDTANAFISLMNIKLVKLLWLVALLIMLVTFGLLNFFVGVNRDNILYFIPISAACGGIVTLLVYIISHSIAKAKYKRIADCDPAADETITFVVSKYGFAACESSTYEGRDLVPWEDADYFIETDKLFMIYKNGVPIAFIPKKAFGKKYAGGAADILALKLEQK